MHGAGTVASASAVGAVAVALCRIAAPGAGGCCTDCCVGCCVVLFKCSGKRGLVGGVDV